MRNSFVDMNRKVRERLRCILRELWWYFIFSVLKSYLRVIEYEKSAAAISWYMDCVKVSLHGLF